jgi:hypothetical protein
MALIQLGGGVTDIRGSIGGTTYSRGPAGNIARRRVKPVNPSSSRQCSRRNTFDQLSHEWVRNLTEDERTAWRYYASNTNFVNALGATIQISALACFIRTNALRLMIGQALTSVAPTAPGQASGLSFTATRVADSFDIIIPAAPQGWSPNTPNDWIIVSESAPQSAGRVAKPTAFTYLTERQGNATPPQFPWTITSKYKPTVGQHCWIRMMHLDPLNRVGTENLYHLVATQ